MRWSLVVLAGLAVVAFGAVRVLGAADDSITTPDTEGNVGQYVSLVLDDVGNPVMAYLDFFNEDLKLLHCDDPNCADEGESITAPHTAGSAGWYATLALDGSGNPVIGHFEDNDKDLKVFLCSDPNCESGSAATPDTAGDVGQFLSLVLDEFGNPVAAYYDATNDDLKVMHCDNPGCAGAGNSITSPDTAGDVGRYTSIALDSAGHPVVAYYDDTNGDLKVMHCNDPACAGGDESITSPDTDGTVGWYASMVLDSMGNPVVAYYDATNLDLKVLRCNDPNCAGDDESITSPDTAGDVGHHASVALDENGNPVVAYHDATNLDLKVLHCDDPNCSGGGESITSPDTAGDVGHFAALVLDGDDEGQRNPVVAYYDATNGDLKVLHCDDPNCADNTPPTLTLPEDVEAEASSSDGATVEFEVTATDADDPSPVVVCDPASGSVFPLGDTVVDCTATDASGNSSEGSFTVSVVDTVAPTLTLPEDVEAEASSSDGATVEFEVTAADVADPAPVVVCDPASGSVFPLGDTVVDCTATDASGNSSEGSFTVSVVDTVAPTLTLPEDVEVEASVPGGAVVDFTVTATDVADPAPAVVCDPASGSVFPLGETVVECTATDAFGNETTASFSVTVSDPFQFEDVPEGHLFDVEIHWLRDEGITFGCNPPDNTRYCPDENVTRGQMAAFLVRALDLPAATDDPFVDTDGSVFVDDVARLAAADITRGCNPPTNDRFCPDDEVTRGQMAAFLVRALGLTDEGQQFEDTVGHVFESDVSRLAAADITRGCNPPANTRFCPDAPVTRGQMAAFLYRALHLES